MRSHPLPGLLVGLPVLLLVLYTLGGLTELGDVGLPTVPFATLLALPIDLWLRDLATAVTVGAAVISIVAPQPSAIVRRLGIGGAAVWLVALCAQLVLTVSEVFARGWAQLADRSVLASLVGELVTGTDLGRVIVAQGVLVAVALVLLMAGSTRVSSVTTLGLVAIAAWLPGLTGHSGIQHGHVAATIGLGLHVVFASVWVGGLIAAAAYIARGGADPALMLRRFSAVALISVLVIAETGLLNASLRLDGPAALVTSSFGAILLAKVAVLIVLIGWGRRHRRALSDDWSAGRHVPDGPTGATFLRWTAWEVVWMGAVYGLSIALSRAAPPGVALPGDRLAPGAIVLLLVGLPMAALFAAPSLVQRFAAVRRYPEAVAVAGVVAVVVAASWQPSRMAADSVGVQVAGGLVIMLLIGCGIVLAPAVASSVPAAVIVMAGLPAATWWIERQSPAGPSAATWCAVLLAEGLVAWASFGPGRRMMTAPEQDSPGSTKSAAPDDAARQEVPG